MDNNNQIALAIIEYMKSKNMFDAKSGMDKATIVLMISNKLGIDYKKQGDLVENAIDDLYKMDIIRSSDDIYDENGNYVRKEITATPEKYYLNSAKIE